MNEDSSVTLIESTADIDAMIEASQNTPVVLLKHSNSCPISSAGHNQFMKLEATNNAEDASDDAQVLPMYMVVVQTARAASNEIAERLNVAHQSPQVIIIDKGEAKSNMSHYNIKTDAVRTAFAELSN